MKSTIWKKAFLTVVLSAVTLDATSALAARKAELLGAALIGGLIGATVVSNFDRDDNTQSELVWSQALNAGYRDTPYSWQGSNHRGRIILVGEGYANGLYCRSYRSEVWGRHGSIPKVEQGVVCRGPDGRWVRNDYGDDLRDDRRRDSRHRDRRPDSRDRDRDRRGNRPVVRGVLPAPGLR